MSTPPAEPPPIKHCWVDGAHGKVPALLLEWRRTTSGAWEGRVIRPVPEGARWAVVDEWVRSELLEPG